VFVASENALYMTGAFIPADASDKARWITGASISVDGGSKL
jgi:hypothetical protein